MWFSTRLRFSGAQENKINQCACAKTNGAKSSVGAYSLRAHKLIGCPIPVITLGTLSRAWSISPRFQKRKFYLAIAAQM